MAGCVASVSLKNSESSSVTSRWLNREQNTSSTGVIRFISIGDKCTPLDKRTIRDVSDEPNSDICFSDWICASSWRKKDGLNASVYSNLVSTITHWLIHSEKYYCKPYLYLWRANRLDNRRLWPMAQKLGRREEIWRADTRKWTVLGPLRSSTHWLIICYKKWLSTTT